jgi:hypothetical protein
LTSSTFSSRCCRRTRHVFLPHSAPPVVVINIEMTQHRNDTTSLPLVLISQFSADETGAVF